MPKWNVYVEWTSTQPFTVNSEAEAKRLKKWLEVNAMTSVLVVQCDGVLEKPRR